MTKRKETSRTDEAHQRLLDIAAQADEAEGIRQGHEDVKNGRVRPAREVLEAFRRSRGIPHDVRSLPAK
jgi:hypothetical protein